MAGRVKKPASDSPKPAYCERIATLLQEHNESQRQLGEAIGENRDAVNNWILNRSKPSFDNIVQIAKHYHVPTDYILGISDVKLEDPTLRAAVEYTGLSEEAIKRLHSIKTFGALKAFDNLITTCDYFDYFDFMHNMEYCFSDYAGIKKELDNKQPPKDPDACIKQSKRLNNRYRIARLSRFDLIESFSNILDRAIETDETRKKLESVIQSNQQIIGKGLFDSEEGESKELLDGGQTNDKQE